MSAAPIVLLHLCDPGRTEKMHAVDPSLESTRNPNKIRIYENRQLTPLDVELECKLKEFRVKLHAEWWKDKEDHFLGPRIFLNQSHIRQLCNLASAGPLTTIDDLRNNFKWNWMDDHGSALLSIIHDVYGPPPLGDPEDVGISETEPPSGSSATSDILNASNSKSHAKLRVKKSAGKQRCSACRGLGHKSKYIAPHHYRVDIHTIPGSNPQCPNKASTSLPTHYKRPILIDFLPVLPQSQHASEYQYSCHISSIN